MDNGSARFHARVVSGAGRGKGLGVPTLNLDLRDVPVFDDGVFAARAFVGEKEYKGALYNGPRPTFKDSRSCEVHLIDESIPVPPPSVEIEVVQFVRGVETFPTPEALSAQMLEDIRQVKAILEA